jgi:hypothetical protein
MKASWEMAGQNEQIPVSGDPFIKTTPPLPEKRTKPRRSNPSPTNLRPQNRLAEWLAFRFCLFTSLLTDYEKPRLSPRTTHIDLMVTKPKIILGLALVLGGISLLGSTAAQSSSHSAKGPSFPTSPPITNANPSIRLPLLVHVPAKLKIERTTDMLSVEIDNQSLLEATNLMVGTNRVTGVKSELYVYPVGETRPAPANDGAYGGLASGLDFNLGTHILHTKPDGIPLPGIKYVVEVDLTAFETDIPRGHFGQPFSKNYKVLWRRTLKQIVE